MALEKSFMVCHACHFVSLSCRFVILISTFGMCILVNTLVSLFNSILVM
jgi:hypothetical protein